MNVNNFLSAPVATPVSEAGSESDGLEWIITVSSAAQCYAGEQVLMRKRMQPTRCRRCSITPYVRQVNTLRNLAR